MSSEQADASQWYLHTREFCPRLTPKIKVLSAYQWTFTKHYKVNYTGVIYGVKKSKR